MTINFYLYSFSISKTENVSIKFMEKLWERKFDSRKKGREEKIWLTFWEGNLKFCKEKCKDVTSFVLLKIEFFYRKPFRLKIPKLIFLKRNFCIIDQRIKVSILSVFWVSLKCYQQLFHSAWSKIYIQKTTKQIHLRQNSFWYQTIETYRGLNINQ